ncbi:MAG: YihA family ribosome biogenesis GTP-binding protein [Gammaproteobacteria bacterium]|nr:YihA family ribosome biogenesis GTP-binding protein [Gammaproteobacteria bacterium]MCK5668272.1 YihA family ribosome biogenesis GTP-binding protein [Gammaproteobacteria bacterium]
MSINHYNKCRFLMGAHEVRQLPEDIGTEVAIAGRSNAGKSSVLNVITANSKLARISKTPGRTQQMNIFVLDDERRLVDLPGYGYAKVPVAMRKHWGATLNKYFQERKALSGLMLIMDIRHPLKPDDQQMIDWSLEVGLPTHVLLNKADKLSRGAGMQLLKQLKRRMNNDLVSIQLFSALKRIGAEEAREVLDQWFEYQ